MSPISNKWNMTDNVYTQSRMDMNIKKVDIDLFYNDGCMGLFENQHDGKPNKCIVDFAQKNNRIETLLYNNSLYFGISKPKKVHKDQYETNRSYIINFFKK